VVCQRIYHILLLNLVIFNILIFIFLHRISQYITTGIINKILNSYLRKSDYLFLYEESVIYYYKPIAIRDMYGLYTGASIAWIYCLIILIIEIILKCFILIIMKSSKPRGIAFILKESGVHPRI